MADLPDNDYRATRATLRRLARKLLLKSSDAGAHLERLRAALDLPGNEAVQGVLADVFYCYSALEKTFKRTAFNIVQARLDVHAERAFKSLIEAAELPLVNALATRWSALSQPSADVVTRMRRCSTDDSRLLAEQGWQAVANDDDAAQEAFLKHCTTCEDKLAFMLARRELIKQDIPLPPRWLQAMHELESAGLERIAQTPQALVI